MKIDSRDSILEFFSKKKLVGENENWKFYVTELTQSATKWALDRWGIDYLLVLLAEEKTLESGSFAIDIFETDTPPQDKDYIILNRKNNQWEYASKDYESILYHIDFIGIAETWPDEGNNKTSSDYKDQDGNKLLQNTSRKRSRGKKEKTPGQNRISGSLSK
jgi:hypothetical protein